MTNEDRQFLEQCLIDLASFGLWPIERRSALLDVCERHTTEQIGSALLTYLRDQLRAACGAKAATVAAMRAAVNKPVTDD